MNQLLRYIEEIEEEKDGVKIEMRRGEANICLCGQVPSSGGGRGGRAGYQDKGSVAEVE